MDKKKKLMIAGGVLALLAFLGVGLVLLITVVFVVTGGPPIEMAEMPENTKVLSKTKIEASGARLAVDHKELDETLRWTSYGRNMCGGNLAFGHLMDMDLLSKSKKARAKRQIKLLENLSDPNNIKALKCGKEVSGERSDENEWYIKFDAGKKEHYIVLQPLGDDAMKLIKTAREDDIKELDPHEHTKELVCVGGWDKEDKECRGRVLGTFKHTDVILSGSMEGAEAFLDEMSPDGANESEELERLGKLAEEAEGAHYAMLMTPKKVPDWIKYFFRGTFDFTSDDEANKEFAKVMEDENAYLAATKTFKGAIVQKIELIFVADSEKGAEDLEDGLEDLLKATIRAEREREREEKESEEYPKLVKFKKANAKIWQTAFKNQKMKRSGAVLKLSFEADPNASQDKAMGIFLKVNHKRLEVSQKIIRDLVKTGGEKLTKADFKTLTSGKILPDSIKEVLAYQRTATTGATVIFGDEKDDKFMFLMAPKGEESSGGVATITYDRDIYSKKSKLADDIADLARASGWKAKTKKGTVTLSRKFDGKKVKFKVKITKEKKTLRAVYSKEIKSEAGGLELGIP